MADKQELEITIDDDGNISIKVIGVDGTKCLELTKEIEAALGDVVAREKTSEYYQEPVEVREQIDQQGG